MKLGPCAFLGSLGVLTIIGLVSACGGGDDAAAPDPGGLGGSNGSEDGGLDSSAGSGGTAGTGGTGAGGYAGDAGEDAPPLPPDTKAVLEVYPMDLWAQFLPKQDYDLEVTESGNPVAFGGSPVVTVPLTKAGTFTVRLDAPDHRTLEVAISYGGGDTEDSASLFRGSELDGQGLSFSRQMREVEGKLLPVHSLYLGLRHLWFSAQGRPARRGNDVRFLMNGEEGWGTVYEDLTGSTESVIVSTWWWESNFELFRDPTNHHTLSQTQRWENTLLGVLETIPAHKRVLVGQFWGQDSILGWMTTDSKLKAYAETPGDGFEFMGMANETKGKFFFEPSPFLFGDRVRDTHAETASRNFDTEPKIVSNVPPRSVDLTQWPVGINFQHASYHQKFMVIDHDIAYVGGMNFRRVDWDTSEHKVFDHRRMLFGASLSDREKVMNKAKLPDTGPRKDYIVRLQGPSAQDVADVFQNRWAHQLAQGVTYADKNTPFSVERNLAPAGTHQVQITATMPEPFWEHAIAESWLNAIAMAERFIFIEDQYFRMPMINDAIVERMTAVPSLRLMVITKPINEWTDPGCAWTHLSHDLFKTSFPDRYQMLQLKAFDTVVTWGWNETESRFVDIDVHSKLLVVDDKFLSVGSCNKNNRGLVYEGEMNVAVLDPFWVRDARRRVFANALPAGTAPSDDVLTWWSQFEQAAAWNDQVYENWKAAGFDISLNGAPLPKEYTPEGFVYSLDFRSLSKCLIENVGPDMVGRDD